MNRREMLLSSAAVAAFAQFFPLRFASAADSPRRKVLFFTKSSGFEHSVIKREGEALAHAEKVLTDLGREHMFDVTATKDGRIFDDGLAEFDVIFFYTTGDLTKAGTDKTPPMSAEGKQRLLDAIASGKGFLGSHCAADTFHSDGPSRESQTEVDPYIAMIGGEFISHGPQQISRQVISAPEFPGLSGTAEGSDDSFRLNDEWYSLKNYAEDLHVILVQDTFGMEGKDYERPPYPATWARRHGDGRVFYTSMGHREDVWTNPKFQQILLGGMRWAAGDVEADISPNMKQVAPGANVMPPA
jgi:type 1 glutamine amidotransferase